MCFDKAIQYKPKFDLAWHHKGIALFDLGKFESALSCFESDRNSA